MSRRPLVVGDEVPDFALPDQNGTIVSLRDLLTTGCLVLFFYPKDDTPGCTAEACAFRDEHQALAEAGACVAGISADDVESHQRFAGKYQLPYRLLSDRDGKLRGRFGVPKTLGLLAGRVTYVIDAHAIVRHVFNSQLRTRQHVEEALRLVRQLRNTHDAPEGERGDTA